MNPSHENLEDGKSYFIMAETCSYCNGTGSISQWGIGEKCTYCDGTKAQPNLIEYSEFVKDIANAILAAQCKIESISAAQPGDTIVSAGWL